jgi:hypothetical protein
VNGKLDYAGFRKACAHLKSYTSLYGMLKSPALGISAFSRFDASGDGLIDWDEFLVSILQIPKLHSLVVI